MDMVVAGKREFIERLPWNGMGEWWDGTWFWLSRIHHKDPALIVLPVLLAVLLTLLRLILSWMFLKPATVWYRLTTEASEKFPESIWKVLYYTVTTSWGVFLVISGPTNPFFDLRSHWDHWSPAVKISPPLYWLYMTQIGFYIHCIYASTYLDTIRKDYSLLMTHHVLTLGLLLFSYVVRFHIIGLLLLVMMDMGDLLLELSKTAFYFKDRNKKKNPGAELLANICFGLFTTQYFFGRLYWYLTKVIYSAMHVSVLVGPKGPYFLLFIPMLWVLFAMQVYWFTLILQLLWKILVLGEVLEDNREIKDNGQIKANGEKLD